MDAKQRIIHCLTCERPFLAYSLPGRRDLSVIEASDVRASEVRFGFFGKNALEVCLARSGVMACQVRELEPTTFEEYADGFYRIVGELESAGGKTVLSRIIRLDADNGVEWRRIVDNLFVKADVNTFRFVYYTLETGIWLGASPELLLREDSDGTLSTMALAGTRPVGTDGGWDNKNLDEHQMVVDHIVRCFEDVHLNPVISGARTVTHGALQHLCHQITARSEVPGLFEELLTRLNPTPALAGWPVDKSLARIAEAEKRPRYCYGGYIALELPDGSRHAYVNLRSCHVSGTNFYLYCGGGLTAQSQLDSEWAETVLKSTAMRSVLEL